MSSDRPVRTRLAPSPTGYFHVGTARTALYNWLHARQHGGAFVLRIEDTDAERHVEEAVTGIQEALRWLDLAWDEGPYRQSERHELYRTAAGRLFEEGRAYWCDLTAEQIAERAKESGRPGYDGFSRDRGLGPGEGRVLRFRVPDDGETVVHDLVRGDVTFRHEHLEDFVVLRSDGTPTFLLAVTVDDIDMAITHVVRGEEHLPNTPKQVLLWQALEGGPLPTFAHLPLLVNEARQKLSKRRDQVALEDYRARGFLPGAIVNYLALLGWSPGDDRELLHIDDLLEAFRLEDVRSAPAFFDVAKMAHINGLHLRELPPEVFQRVAEPFLPPQADGWRGLEELVPLVQTRVETLDGIPDLLGFLFVADDAALGDEALATLEATPRAREVLSAALGAYESADWDAETLHATTRQVGEELGLNLRKTQAPIRLATTGSRVGLPLFEALHVLGRERTERRLRLALDRLSVAAP